MNQNQIYIPWDGKTSMDNYINSEIATYYYIIELNTGQKTYNGSITFKTIKYEEFKENNFYWNFIINRC